MLADPGATVDKIEDAEGGDYLRHLPPQVAGESVAFHLLNRGKRSCVLDLKKAEGRAAFLRLLPRYDVLFDQFRPGVLGRLGLGHDVLREKHPKLVICALTGYGQTGPLAQRAGHDINYLARAGVLGAQGPAGAPPAVPGFQLADVSGGLWCAIAILGALRERDRTGSGAVLDIAMTDGALGFASTTLANALAGVPVRRGDEVLSGGIAPYNTYETQDGAFVALGALEPKFWMGFCAAVGLEASMEALVPGPHQVELKRKVVSPDIIRAKTRAAWEAFGRRTTTSASSRCSARTSSAPIRTSPRAGSSTRCKRRAAPGSGSSACRSRPAIAKPLRAAPFCRASTPAPILAEGGLSDAEIDALIAANAARG